MGINATADVMDARDLALQFESIGDNCELGLVQRRAGVEPLGLLRFAGAPIRNIIRALHNRFDRLDDPQQVRIQVENGEYMVKLQKYDLYYHAGVLAKDVGIETVYNQQCRTLPFLVRKLISDLENPDKIFVFRQNEPLLATDLLDLRLAIAAYGPGVLLWVREACEGHLPGTVDIIDPRLMVGYVRRLAEREDVPSLDYKSWTGVLRQASAIWQGGMIVPIRFDPITSRPPGTQVLFGTEGNAIPSQGFGWSGPEGGYTWSIGQRSLLSIERPAMADEYWLEMDVIPFTAAPLLPRQRLDVIVSGQVVASFDPVPRGVITCVVPGALTGHGKTIDITFNHPFAASPMLVTGQGDDRRLAVSFRRVGLYAH